MMMEKLKLILRIIVDDVGELIKYTNAAPRDSFIRKVTKDERLYDLAESEGVIMDWDKVIAPIPEPEPIPVTPTPTPAPAPEPVGCGIDAGDIIGSFEGNDIIAVFHGKEFYPMMVIAKGGKLTGYVRGFNYLSWDKVNALNAVDYTCFSKTDTAFNGLQHPVRVHGNIEGWDRTTDDGGYVCFSKVIDPISEPTPPKPVTPKPVPPTPPQATPKPPKGEKVGNAIEAKIIYPIEHEGAIVAPNGSAIVKLVQSGDNGQLVTDVAWGTDARQAASNGLFYGASDFKWSFNTNREWQTTPLKDFDLTGLEGEIVKFTIGLRWGTLSNAPAYTFETLMTVKGKDTFPSWFNLSRNGTTLKDFDLSEFPNNIKLPKGKLAVIGSPEDYLTAPHPSNDAKLKTYGATHFEENQYLKVEGTQYYHTKKDNGGLVPDAWPSRKGAKPHGAPISEITNIEQFVQNFYSWMSVRCGGNTQRGSSDWNYRVFVINGEEFNAIHNNSGLEAWKRCVKVFFDWAKTSEEPNRYLGIWASGAVDNLSGNIKKDNATYLTGGQKTVFAEAGFNLVSPYFYISNNDSSMLYTWMYNLEISLRLNPEVKHIPSIWEFEEKINSSAGNYAYTEEDRVNYPSDSRGSKRKAIHSYDDANGSVSLYEDLPVVNPMLFYTTALVGLFLADGIYAFGYGQNSNRKEDLVKIGNQLAGQDGNAIFCDNSGILKFLALAMNKASEYSDILEENTKFIIPEFRVDGGAWITGDDRLIPNCAANELPIIRLKYNSDFTECVVLAFNPVLNNPTKPLTQVVEIRDVSTGLSKSFTLKSVAPFLDRLKISFFG
jgi:hypothetical protein